MRRASPSRPRGFRPKNAPEGDSARLPALASGQCPTRLSPAWPAQPAAGIARDSPVSSADAEDVRVRTRRGSTARPSSTSAPPAAAQRDPARRGPGAARCRRRRPWTGSGAEPTDVLPDQLLKDAPVAASYLPLPPGAMTVEDVHAWAKTFDRWLARTQRLDVPARGRCARGRDAVRPSGPSAAASQSSWSRLSGSWGSCGGNGGSRIASIAACASSAVGTGSAARAGAHDRGPGARPRARRVFASMLRAWYP